MTSFEGNYIAHMENPKLKIDKLEVTNFKNYTHLEVDFKEGINLFVGANGSGKTSILEAINIAVGSYFGSGKSQNSQRTIDSDEIKITNGIRESSTIIEASAEGIGTWSRSRSFNSNDSKKTANLKNFGESFFNRFEDIDNESTAPIIAYYSTQRLFKDASQSSKQTYDPKRGRQNGYLQCLEDSAIKPILDDWLGKATAKRATLAIKEIADTNLVLENVEEVIRQALKHFMELPSNFPLKIYPDAEYDNELYLEFNGKALPLKYHSDGFRNLLYLMIDITWRASQLNPFLTLEELKQVNGVITIDEIDLHLHPKWQEKSLDLLHKLYPNIQFFITTHSPTVVANFNCGTLYVLEGNEIKVCDEKYFGKEVNNVLRTILGGHDRHVATKQKIESLFSKIDNNENEEASLLLENLTILLGEEDRDIQNAKALLEWNQSKTISDAVH
ncbi:MAG: putative ATP-binding protein involved in virulence [Bacteroidia bacterium]